MWQRVEGVHRPWSLIWAGGRRGGAGCEGRGRRRAVTDGMMGDCVFAGDFLGAKPAEVVIVDESTVRVMADRAFCGSVGRGWGDVVSFLPDLGFFWWD